MCVRVRACACVKLEAESCKLHDPVLKTVCGAVYAERMEPVFLHVYQTLDPSYRKPRPGSRLITSLTRAAVAHLRPDDMSVKAFDPRRRCFTSGHMSAEGSQNVCGGGDEVFYTVYIFAPQSHTF